MSQHELFWVLHAPLSSEEEPSVLLLLWIWGGGVQGSLTFLCNVSLYCGNHRRVQIFTANVCKRASKLSV